MFKSRHFFDRLFRVITMIKEISSKENRIFKECQKLSQKKYRDREGLYLVEGENLLAETPSEQIHYIVSKKGKESLVPPALKTQQIYVMDERLFDKIAQTETSQGIMAVIEKQTYSAEELGSLCGAGTNLVVLDRLQDPGNIGTILRTAEGAGYAAAVIVKGTGDVYSPKTIRSAAGSVFRIPIIHVEDNRELRKLVDSLGKRLTVTCFDTDNDYFDVDLSKDTALVIGNEGNGVSLELIEMADIKVKIPMKGRLESLNASVAAGILMYEAARHK
ncbi:TrmH family RNA methyltransferase [Senimuribacter intestinalis]|uniref:TrmH family RNA methyltransferase n=1 Tax=Senimuribacter intestinalis TaxID=2941507 RepID=UPI0020404FD8|nr:RNA methyltransferase [Senimuribacter intestinalis]